MTMLRKIATGKLEAAIMAGDHAGIDAIIADMHRAAAGEALIAASRPSIRLRLRDALDECQADYDEEREFGWALEQRGDSL